MPDAFPNDLVHSPQRDFALEVVKRLDQAGYQALWAGGCVRDALLGRVPKDYDIATSATPEQVRDVFGKRRTLAIGAAFGVITVLGPKPAGQIEVATFRTDTSYSDGRRPDGVQFTSPQHDAERRDFTINGLFYDPLTQQVIDYVNGQQDLQRKVVRAIGNPEQRIEEDKLRMLRAVRFAATFDFSLDAPTAQAISKYADQLPVVSAERIGAELERMLCHANRSQALQQLRQVQLLQQVLPETASLSETEFAARLAVLNRLDQPQLATCLVAALPYNSTATSATQVARRLKYSNEVCDQAGWMQKQRALIDLADQSPWPQVQRVLVHPSGPALVDWCEAESGAPTPATQFCRNQLAQPNHVLNPNPLLSGSDLIAAGFRPGPMFGKLLEQIRDQQLLGVLKTKQQAIEYAQGCSPT